MTILSFAFHDQQGYSYGSVCASSVVDDFPEILGFAAVAYPFSYLWALTFFNSTAFLTKSKSRKPKLFVVGTRDNFTGLAAFQRQVADFPDPKRLEVIRGADHFFYGIEGDVARKVDSWISEVVLQPETSTK